MPLGDGVRFKTTIVLKHGGSGTIAVPHDPAFFPWISAEMDASLSR